MKLRPTTVNDLTSVMSIINQAKEYFKNANIDQWQDGYPNETSIINDIKKNEAYVIEDNNKIIATAMISIANEPTYNYIEGKWLQNNQYIVIHRIAVNNNYKGKGLAKYILDEAIKLHPQINSIRIDTHENNISMQRFLTKYGFTYCGNIFLANQSLRRAYEKII